MGDWTYQNSTRWSEDDQAGSYGTTVTGSASANTKGAWAVMAASLPFDIDGFWLNMRYGSGQNLLIDIGVGAGGSEVVLVANMHVGPSTGIGGGSFFLCHPIWIPLRLPKGTRMAARLQSSTGGSLTAIIKMQLVAATYPKAGGFHRAATVGANTGTSAGVSATSGASNVKGAWAELSASLPMSCKHVVFLGVAPTGSSVDIALDLGIGVAASEVVVVPNLFYSTVGGRGYNGVWSLPLSLRSGVRLAYRLKAGAGAEPFTADAVLIG